VRSAGSAEGAAHVQAAAQVQAAAFVDDATDDPLPEDPLPADGRNVSDHPDPVAGQPHFLQPGTARRGATDAERRALASVLRLRILRLCLYEPLTNRQIAQRLDRNPATVLHHVRTLADQGFLVAGQPRRGRRGSREIPYRATGKSWTLELAEPAATSGAAAGSNTLLRTILAEVALVPESEVDASRLGLQLSDEHTEELRSRLAAVLDEFARRPQDPGGRRWSLFLAFHPEP
jgi:DNA-binding transcriptional ArsR family regulator